MRIPWGQSPIQDDFHTEAGKVDIPGFNQRVQKGDAIFCGQVEDIGVQELEDEDPHLLIAAPAEPGYQVEPVLTL